MSQLEDLLQQCTVKITVPGGWGTGFFVAPGWILTCHHVVREANGQPVPVRWQKVELEAVVERSLPAPYDLALLRVNLSANDNPPCVYLDAAVQSRDPLYLFGYPDQDFPNGCPVAFSCEGLTGDEPALIKFALGQVRPGMSGSPLLNQRTGKVCGMVKFTRDRSFDLGGGAIPTRVILEQFPELQELQREFHGGDRRWSNSVGQQPAIDFQAYLRSIATTYEKWWQFYTLTDAEGKQRQAQEPAPIFDFGLMVQTVLKEEREQPQSEQEQSQATQEQEKIERFSVLEGLRTYVDRHRQVLLVGRPGSGKSTALARLMLEEATTQKLEVPQKSQFSQNCDFSDHSQRIPVLVELRYWQGSIAQLILDAFNRHECSVTVAQLETVLARSLILFDGVNELPSEEARSQLMDFRRNHPKVLMIFTTRDLSLGGDLGIEHRLEMQPLTEPQMQAFIRAYVPEQAEDMLRQLKERLRAFGQTPLLLWMLCEVFQQAPNNQLPSNLGGVFQAFTQMYEASSVRKHEVALLKGDVRPLSDRRLWKQALTALAAAMMQGETPVDFRVVMQRDEAEQELRKVFPNEPFPVRDLLDDLLKYHLLQNRSIAQIEFRHQLLQEYYAAEHLLKRLPNLTDEQLKRDYLNYLKWTEPVALMLALAEELQTVRVIQLALCVDWMLGANLISNLRDNFQPVIFSKVMELRSSLVYKIRLVELTKSREGFQLLLQLAKHKSFTIRKQAISSLGKIGDLTVVKPLLENAQLGDEIFVSDALIEIAKKTDANSIERLLIELLPNSSNRIQKHIVLLLENANSREAIQTLVNILHADDKSIAWRAIYALGKIADPVVVPQLIKLLKEQDLFFMAKVALENICHLTGSQEAKVALDEISEQLNKNLEVKDNRQKYCIDMKNYQQMLKSKDLNEKRAAIQFLGTLEDVRGTTIIEDLSLALLDTTPFIRKNVAISLAKIGTAEALKALLLNSYSYDDYTREVVIDSFSYLKDRLLVINRLNEALNDSSPIIRKKAEILLGSKLSNIRKNRLLLQVSIDSSQPLENLVETFDKILSEFPKRPTWRSRTSELVYVIQDRNITRKYREELAAWENQVQEAAIRLAQTASSKAIQVLIQNLKSYKHRLAQQIIPVLANIEAEEAMISTIDYLNENSPKIRDLTAKNLLIISREKFIKYLQDLAEKAKYEIVLDTLIAIQTKFKYYNYEIWQAAIQTEKLKRQKG